MSSGEAAKPPVRRSASGYCWLGHTQRAHECPACGEEATGQTAKLEHWRWYRGRTSSKRIKALIDVYLAALDTSDPQGSLPKSSGPDSGTTQ